MNENFEKVELSLEDLEKVNGGSLLDGYYDVFASLGGVAQAVALLSQGKQVVVNFICEFMTKYAAPFWSSMNKEFSQKVYDMLPHSEK